ncbi:hypothetical protein Tco_1573107, partial [Tanacetum coccineum]
MSDLKKIDLSAEALAALKTQAPSVVDKYLGSKVGDVFQKELKKHTADLIQKYSLHQIPELPKKQIPTVDLEQGSENKLRSNKRRSLLSSQQTRKLFKNHKEKHDDDEDDDDEDDDDEDPPAGSNQGKQTKRRRTKYSESSKKPSTTKETPKGKASSKGSKTSKSALAKEPVEEPIDEVVIDDADRFKQSSRPPTPNLERNKHHVVLDQPEQPWFNQMVSATKDPLIFDYLMATPIDFS